MLEKQNISKQEKLAAGDATALDDIIDSGAAKFARKDDAEKDSAGVRCKGDRRCGGR